jgi:hypothetical protein
MKQKPSVAASAAGGLFHKRLFSRDAATNATNVDTKGLQVKQENGFPVSRRVVA